jgi:acetyl esterase/lipase
LTLAYAEALRKHGGTVNVTVAPGLPHSILLEPFTIDRLKDIVSGAGR